MQTVFGRYNPAPGSELYELGQAVEAARSEFEAINDRLADLRAELAGLPPVHWRMTSQEAANVLGRHQALSQLITCCQQAQRATESKLRTRQNTINGIRQQIDTYASRVEHAKIQDGYPPAQLAAAIQQAQAAFDAVRRRYCEPPDAGNGNGSANGGGLVEVPGPFIPDVKEDQSHVAGMDPFTPILQRNIKQ